MSPSRPSATIKAAANGSTHLEALRRRPIIASSVVEPGPGEEGCDGTWLTTVGILKLAPRGKFFQPCVLAHACSRALTKSTHDANRVSDFFIRPRRKTASICGP